MADCITTGCECRACKLERELTAARAERAELAHLSYELLRELNLIRTKDAPNAVYDPTLRTRAAALLERIGQ